VVDHVILGSRGLDAELLKQWNEASKVVADDDRSVAVGVRTEPRPLKHSAAQETGGIDHEPRLAGSVDQYDPLPARCLDLLNERILYGALECLETQPILHQNHGLRVDELALPLQGKVIEVEEVQSPLCLGAVDVGLGRDRVKLDQLAEIVLSEVLDGLGAELG